MNIPEVKLGIIAVSRDCFPIALSQQRRKNIVAAYGDGLYECPITVENEKDAQAALADVRANGVNALVVFLGNFGPETPETLLCQKFHGPVMYVAAAEGDGDLINVRGDARGLRLHHLCPAHFPAVCGNEGVQSHVLALKGGHPVAVLFEHPAKPGAQQALARVGHGALNHNIFRHGYAPFRILSIAAISISFSSCRRTATRYQPAVRPG